MEKVQTEATNAPASTTPVRTFSWNKDNFWNLMFWFGMTTGTSISVTLSELELVPKLVSSAIMWATLILVPYFVSRRNKVTYDPKEKIFLNSQNEPITGRCPSIVSWIAATVLACIAFGNIINGKDLDIVVSATMMLAIIFGTPVLFFMFNDCPITLLFSRDTWRADYAEGTRSSASTSRSYMDEIQSPSYRYLPWNNFHKRN